MAFILTMSAVVWGVSDKTGKVEDDENDDDVQNDPDMARTHLKTFPF